MVARVPAVRRRSGFRALQRALRYRLLIPVLRSTHSPEYTARGVANGVFWGLTPTVGLQTIEITSTWLVGRALLGKDSSLLQAYIWVWVNNPVTMIPMYFMFYVTGLVMLGDLSSVSSYDAFVVLWTRGIALSWWDGFLAMLQAIGAPLFLGASPYALVGTLLAYRWALALVRRRHRRLGRADA